MQVLCSARKLTSIILLGMPYYERLQLLSIDCQITNDQHNKGQINEQTKQEKSPKRETVLIMTCMLMTKLKQEIGYFIAGAGTGADKSGKYRNNTENT